MPIDIAQEDNSAAARIARKTTPAAALAALGIVYGDLGTSPLYTLQAVLGATGGHFYPAAALGSLSLIFWALIITISVKYCVFVMRADNHGEGGTLALMSLVTGRLSCARPDRPLVVVGLFGAALIYGDGIITPAISVFSALEGSMSPLCVQAADVLLASWRSCSRCSPCNHAAPPDWPDFGPVMLLWFTSSRCLGC